MNPPKFRVWTELLRHSLAPFSSTSEEMLRICSNTPKFTEIHSLSHMPFITHFLTITLSKFWHPKKFASNLSSTYFQHILCILSVYPQHTLDMFPAYSDRKPFIIRRSWCRLLDWVPEKVPEKLWAPTVLKSLVWIFNVSESVLLNKFFQVLSRSKTFYPNSPLECCSETSQNFFNWKFHRVHHSLLNWLSESLSNVRQLHGGKPLAVRVS